MPSSYGELELFAVAGRWFLMDQTFSFHDLEVKLSSLDLNIHEQQRWRDFFFPYGEKRVDEDMPIRSFAITEMPSIKDKHIRVAFRKFAGKVTQGYHAGLLKQLYRQVPLAPPAVPAAPTRSFYGTASSAPTASSNSAPLRILPDDPFEDPPDSPLFPVQRAARSPLADILDSSMELPEEHDAHSDDSSEEERSVEGASSADLVLPDDEGLGLGGDEYDDPDDLSYRTTSSDEDSEDEESEEGSSTASDHGLPSFEPSANMKVDQHTPPPSSPPRGGTSTQPSTQPTQPAIQRPRYDGSGSKEIISARAAAKDRVCVPTVFVNGLDDWRSQALNNLSSLAALRYFDLMGRSPRGSRWRHEWMCRCCFWPTNQASGSTTNLSRHLKNCPDREEPRTPGLAPYRPTPRTSSSQHRTSGGTSSASTQAITAPHTGIVAANPSPEDC
ncbi:unnamed protein product [Tilletia caries]|uniref:BED-type domain-containing protein n=1 Tax=Tilletia caries TaxID=13290 RepID=A0ABN7J7P0_9BASI|nr:unnamed protein product [Tilletia caries]